jgi:hypothetical protein
VYAFRPPENLQFTTLRANWLRGYLGAFIGEIFDPLPAATYNGGSMLTLTAGHMEREKGPMDIIKIDKGNIKKNQEIS